MSAPKAYKTPLRGFSSRREPAKPDSRASLPDEKTKTALGRNGNIFVGGILLLLLVLSLNPVSRQAIECSQFHTPVNGTAEADGNIIQTETVTNAEAQAKGLSGRPCIKEGQAMLFVFKENNTSNNCLWMKDMRFPIDMVWLDESKRVIYRALDVDPSTYPKTICPGTPTRYILEVKANSAEKLGLTVSTVISF